jgi:hypothetical protein
LTPIEIILLLSVVALTAQVLILQRHYTEKLSDQAMVLGYLLDFVMDKTADSERVDQIRDKIFNSSQ